MVDLTKLKNVVEEIDGTRYLKRESGLEVEYYGKDYLCKGLCLYKEPRIAVQKISMKKGVVPEHSHTEIEHLIIYVGTCEVTINGKKHVLLVGDSILIYPNTKHVTEALEDVEMIAITIPASEVYPNGK